MAKVDSGSEEEFQDSKEETPPRSLAQSNAAPRVPQSTLQTTGPPSPPNLTARRIETAGPVESPQTPSSVESANAAHTANPVGRYKIFS